MGECRVNIDDILIEDNIIESAQKMCLSIDDINVRNRAVSNIISAGMVKNIFENENIDVDIESGIHNLDIVLKDIDIADVYINNTHADVRFYFEDEQPRVPKCHFEYNIEPVAYLFIKLKKDLTSGNLAGFMSSETIKENKIDEDNNYIYINDNDLVSYYDISSLLINYDIAEDIDDIEYYEYLDKKLNNKYEFYKKLFNSKNNRLKFAKIVNASNVLNFISKVKNDEDEDSTLIEDLQNDMQNTTSDSIEVYDDSESVLDTTLSILDELDVIPNEESTSDSQDNPDIESYINEDFSTEITPNLDDNSVTDTIADTDLIKDTISSDIDVDYNEKQNNSDDSNIQESNELNNSIEELFNEERLESNSENSRENTSKTKKAPVLPVILLALLVLCAGYFGINKITKDNSSENDSVENTNIQTELDNTDAMPMESVSTLPTTNIQKKEEGNAVSIPAIEKNLDASVLVSNLKINWEVPSGYASNTTAKRYLVKLGKVIQLNLKSELLLLSKPPLTNKIALEIRFNNSAGKFEPVGFVTSSGEQSVDKVIMDTVTKALNMKLSTNYTVFSKIQGNPVLIIQL